MTNVDSCTNETMALPPITKQYPQWSRSTLLPSTHYDTSSPSGGSNAVELKRVVSLF